MHTRRSPRQVQQKLTTSKLLFGILTQIRESSIKLDYSKLAQHMGPGKKKNILAIS